jgi:mannan endo-1,4-beta-mannosidase
MMDFCAQQMIALSLPSRFNDRAVTGMIARAVRRCIVAAFAFLTACGGDSATPLTPTPVREDPQTAYAVRGTDIQFNRQSVVLSGANGLHVYGPDSDDMPTWNARIAREFIRDLEEQPITGSAIFSTRHNAWFHSLRTVVERNRRNGMVTILCPFGWGTDLILGMNPSDQVFYSRYIARLQAVATEFRNEPDVWIELWNEPYWFTGGNGYSPDVWLRDMSQMVDAIRGTGNPNIVVVPGAETGQSEAPILSHGARLLATRSNVLFDLHFYEKWLVGQSEAQIAARLAALKAAGAAVLIGEISPYNVSDRMDVTPALRAAQAARVGALAWVWKRDTNDRAALLTDTGQPNDAANGGWGTTFRAYLSAAPR